MNQQKPTIRPSQSNDRISRKNKLRELVETRVDQELGEADNDRSGTLVDQVISAHIAEKLVTVFLIVGQSRGRRMVDDSSRIQDDSTRTVLQTVTKSMLATLDQEKS